MCTPIETYYFGRPRCREHGGIKEIENRCNNRMVYARKLLWIWSHWGVTWCWWQNHNIDCKYKISNWKKTCIAKYLLTSFLIKYLFLKQDTFCFRIFNNFQMKNNNLSLLWTSCEIQYKCILYWLTFCDWMTDWFTDWQTV